jgi:hypothetical protein
MPGPVLLPPFPFLFREHISRKLEAFSFSFPESEAAFQDVKLSRSLGPTLCALFPISYFLFLLPTEPLMENISYCTTGETFVPLLRDCYSTHQSFQKELASSQTFDSNQFIHHTGSIGTLNQSKLHTYCITSRRGMDSHLRTTKPPNHQTTKH